MGQQNIKRLVEKLKFPAITKNIMNCLSLIDKVYYEKLIYCEEYDDINNSTIWFFEDGSRIKLTFDETCLYLLILEAIEHNTEEIYN
jgi:hypothetical protein